MRNNLKINYGDIVYVDFGKAIGSEQGGVRPAIIMSNDTFNKFSPTVTAIPLTSSESKKYSPVHVNIKADKDNGLDKDSIILVEKIKDVDKTRLVGNVIGNVKSKDIINNVKKAILKQFNISVEFQTVSI